MSTVTIFSRGLIGVGVLSLGVIACVEPIDNPDPTTSSTTDTTTTTITSTTTTTTSSTSSTSSTTTVIDPLPDVLSFQPDAGATGVSTTPIITITFTEPMDAATITGNATSTQCSGSVQLSRNNFSSCLRLKYQPAANGDSTAFDVEPIGILAGSTVYQVRVTQQATAQDGDKLLTIALQTPGFTTEVDLGQGAYYENVNTTLNGNAFADELHKLIDDHSRLSYDEVWDAFTQLDQGIEGCDANQIFDFYADRCWTSQVDRCGSSNCYNREHSWPKSWFNCSVSSTSKGNEPGCTDLHHIFPSDAGANSSKGNLGLGVVSSDQYPGDSAKTGNCISDGSPSKCWEPDDKYKGDLARAYLYFSIRYRNELLCCDTEEVEEHAIDLWMEDVLREWHEEDSVSGKERDRNDGIEGYQGNRNPFVDHPNWVVKISDF